MKQLKKYRVTFNSGYENYYMMQIGNKIVQFSAKYDGVYLIKLNSFFLEVVKEEKMNMIEVLHHL